MRRTRIEKKKKEKYANAADKKKCKGMLLNKSTATEYWNHIQFPMSQPHIYMKRKQSIFLFAFILDKL